MRFRGTVYRVHNPQMVVDAAAGRPVKMSMLVRSFTVGDSEGDVNLVMWRWGDVYPTRVTVIDKQDRLTHL